MRKSVAFHWLDEFVGVTLQQKTDAAFDAPAVFVGHGIVAPEYQWDDYKGIDVRGKVVVLFTNEPPSGRSQFLHRARAHLLRTLDLQISRKPRGTAQSRLSSFTPRRRPATDGTWCAPPGAARINRCSWRPGARDLAFAGWVTKEAGEKIAAAAGQDRRSNC